jgi:hypothetical protein
VENLSCEPDVTNSVGSSGKFIDLARSGRLLDVSSLIQERAEAAEYLKQITAKLEACNSPARLAEFAIWCGEKKKDFGSALRKTVRELEKRKCELQAKLRQIDRAFAREKTNLELTQDSVAATSLVPKVTRGGGLPSVAIRNAVIDKNLYLSHINICKRLDLELGRVGQCTPGLPDSWTEDFGVKTFVEAYRHSECRKRRVHKMLSVRRGLASCYRRC